MHLPKSRTHSPQNHSFYDVNKPVVISCDASQSSLGAPILEDEKPVVYASHALSGAEKCYAQIEKELLAVVFSLPNSISMYAVKMSL